MNSYLIIAGISKAGTTSLFDYLVDHPSIEGSSIKQTFFFLDKDLQQQLNLKSIYDYEEGLEQFEQYFLNSNKTIKYRVEATPDYLYSPGTPDRLKEFFKNRQGKVLMILRNPVTRFNSFYYYGKQQGLVPEDMTYQKFYEASKGYTQSANPCLMAYDTGFYGKYLKKYKEVFGNELDVVFFEEMTTNPKSVLQNLCKDLNIDSVFYENYSFQVKNKTVQTRNQGLAKVYGGLRQFYLDNFYETKTGVKMAKLLKNTVTPVYKKLNYQPLVKNEGDNIVNEKLRQDYKEDILLLGSLIQKELPWGKGGKP